MLDGHFACDVLYRVSEGIPPCPCGAPRIIFYATLDMKSQARTPTHFGEFKDVLLGDTLYTSKEELDAYRTRIATEYNVPLEQVEVVGKGNKREKLDAIKHESYLKKRAAGFDTDAQWKRHQKEQERLHYDRQDAKRRGARG